MSYIFILKFLFLYICFFYLLGKKIKLDVAKIFILFFLIFSLFLVFPKFNQAFLDFPNKFSFPVIWLLGLIITSLLLFLQKKEETKHNYKVVVSIFLIFIYLFLIKYIGFYISSFLYLMLFPAYLNKRIGYKLCFLNTFVLIVVYFIFTYVIKISFPKGALFYG